MNSNILKRTSGQAFNQQSIQTNNGIQNQPQSEIDNETSQALTMQQLWQKNCQLQQNIDTFTNEFRTLQKNVKRLTFQQNLLTWAIDISVSNQNRKNLVEIIMEEYDEESEYLKLNRLCLCTLPSVIADFSHLTTLDLSKNTFFNFPRVICTLPNLFALNFKNNQLRDLPNEIGNIKKLRTLIIQNNCLKTLPKTITNLTYLLDLKLGGNLFETLPDFLSELTYLDELDLSNNKLTSLPETLGQVRFLRILNLSDNVNLQKLPSSLENCRYLKEINLCEKKHSKDRFFDEDSEDSVSDGDREDCVSDEDREDCVSDEDNDSELPTSPLEVQTSTILDRCKSLCTNDVRTVSEMYENWKIICKYTDETLPDIESFSLSEQETIKKLLTTFERESHFRDNQFSIGKNLCNILNNTLNSTQIKDSIFVNLNNLLNLQKGTMSYKLEDISKNLNKKLDENK